MWSGCNDMVRDGKNRWGKLPAPKFPATSARIPERIAAAADDRMDWLDLQATANTLLRDTHVHPSFAERLTAAAASSCNRSMPSQCRMAPCLR